MIKIFADGADLASIRELAQDPRISGFTTNPTLMRKAGITNYERFARDALGVIGDRPISFEVFADEFDEMARQARKIAFWGPNVYVKIPITNTRGEPSYQLIRELSVIDRVQVNVTAICTLGQVRAACLSLEGGVPAVISVFAGRIADTGRDPVRAMEAARSVLNSSSASCELLWASPREILNVRQAGYSGAHIITLPPDLLAKLALADKDLEAYSLETVKMFHADAQAAGYEL